MEQQIIDFTTDFASVLPTERARLVRLCATITGDRDAAEDLAQETLLEAWRHLHELRDAERRAQWLSGIARNVCLRWQRKRGRDLTRLTIPLIPSDESLNNIPTLASLEDTLADDVDIEMELERKELVELLDRAMALLPIETRNVLVKRYVDESSLAEVAAQLGTNANAVAMKIQRGKLALRHVLKQELGQEIAAYYVDNADEERWEETRIWCIHCGQRRLIAKLVPDKGEFLLKCPLCCADPQSLLSENDFPALFEGIKGHKPALSRLIIWANNYYRTALKNGTIPCINCGRATPVNIGIIPDITGRVWGLNERVVNIICPACSSRCITPIEYLSLSLPEGQRFWREHTRIRNLPKRYVERDGRAAVVVSFESVLDTARYDVISDNETYRVLHIEVQDGRI